MAVISVLARLRRPRLAPRDPAPAEAPAPAAPVPAPAALAFDAELVDGFETDMLSAIRNVAVSALDARSEAVQAASDLVRVSGFARELSEGGRGAAIEVTGLAASAEELAATAGEIDQAVTRAQASLREAVGGSREASGMIGELARASDEIGGIVDAISSVAAQTHLLALNATIEAARAGAAGRGFAVVAAEVKALSVEASSAASLIRSRIDALRRSADASIARVGDVLRAVESVGPVFDAVQSAVAEQTVSVAELARRSGETSSFVEQVSERAQETHAIVNEATARMTRAGRAAETADHLVEGLGRRFTTVLRHSRVGDRRRADRFPIEFDVAVTIEGRAGTGRSVDLSLGGILIATELSVAAGDLGMVEAPSVGRLPVRVVERSPLGLHCAFEGIEPATRARIADLLGRIERDYRPLVAAATEAAAEVEAAFEAALRSGALSTANLFGAHYRPIAGTDPQQYEIDGLATVERLLRPIQEPLLAADPTRVFCIAIDRNGYVPVHNLRYSEPQRPNDLAWNVVHSRNRRIFDDRAGITAARSTRPYVIQAYARDMGSGSPILMREIDVPVRVQGRHWGGFRMAYRL